MPICTEAEANALIESSLSSTVDAQQRKPRPLNTHTRFGDERAEWAEGDTVLGDAGRNPSSSSTAADKTFEPTSMAVETVGSTMVLLEHTDALHGSSDESSVGGAPGSIKGRTRLKGGSVGLDPPTNSSETRERTSL